MEKLYNNIVLPELWPPRDIDPVDMSEIEVPYLKEKPEVIDISVGRQLFVDDFLISETDGLYPFYHKAVKFEGNPVLVPETDEERNVTIPGACPRRAAFGLTRNTTSTECGTRRAGSIVLH